MQWNGKGEETGRGGETGRKRDAQPTSGGSRISWWGRFHCPFPSLPFSPPFPFHCIGDCDVHCDVEIINTLASGAAATINQL